MSPQSAEQKEFRIRREKMRKKEKKRSEIKKKRSGRRKYQISVMLILC